jgi:hypothetical protein
MANRSEDMSLEREQATDTGGGTEYATEYAKARTPDQSGIPHHHAVDPSAPDPHPENAEQSS